ncbi:MAG: AMP-binding protein [Candidatus Dactylopiibacterium sp.]|nr:AMP-binding protein [Candidatus Dactylopiibacterium sp.]
MLKPFLKACLRVALRLVFRLRIHGNPQVRAERLLIVANHESFLDELLLSLFLPQRPLVVVYASATHNRLFRLLVLRLIDYVAIDQNNPMELKSVIRLLETGRPVLIFPEGRVTTTGNLMKTYDGPGFIAAKAAATILPVRIEGAARSYFSLLRGNFQRHLFPAIRLCVQEPTRIETQKAPHGEQHELAAQSMHRVMTGLMFAGRAEQTLFAALVEAAGIQGRHWRLLGDVERVDFAYADLLRSAMVLGRLLAARVAEGERVGLLLPNTAAQLALVFGLGAWRRTPTLLNAGVSAGVLQVACEAAALRRIVTSRAFVEQARLQDKLAALSGIEWIYLEDLHGAIRFTDRAWWLLWARYRPLRVLPATRPEDPALVMFTSGSEHKCKGVQLSHRALLSNVSQLRSVLDFSVNDVVVNALPLSNPFGLTCGALIPLLCGARVFLHPSQHYRVIPEMASHAACTILVGTNAFLGHFGQNAHPFDLHKLRYVIAGGDRVSEEVRQLWFERFGVRIFEGYGTTETAPVISLNTQMAYRGGSVGQFLPSIRHRLTPLVGMAARFGGTCGQLHVSGPNLMEGYLRHQAPGQLQPPFSPVGAGWHDTGDIVEVDADGFVYVRGRVKRFHDAGGVEVSLGALELAVEAALGEPGALLPDPLAPGELVLITTQPVGDPAALRTAILAAGFPAAAVPGRHVVTPRLPASPERARPDYAALRAIALAQ